MKSVLLRSSICFGLIVVATSSARAAEIGPTPWHLVDLWWEFAADAPLESYSIDVIIKDDVPEEVKLYIAPIGLGKLSGTPFYGGLQTQADGYTKSDRRLRKIGPGLLMSMWNERSFDAIRPSLGGFCQSSGHEGNFVSVRRPYRWVKGKYTYKIVRMDNEVIDGKAFTWVGAFVYSHNKDENVFIGALRFPGDRLVLSRRVASFVEIYGPRIPLERIPKVQVEFGNLRINGAAAKLLAVSAVYPVGVPDYATAAAAEGSVIVEVGQPQPESRSRRVQLLPAAAP